MRTEALEPGPAPKAGPFPYVMNTAQVASFLGVSPQTVRDLMRRRRLPHVHLGAQTLRFLRPRLEEWLLAEHDAEMEGGTAWEQTA